MSTPTKSRESPSAKSPAKATRKRKSKSPTITAEDDTTITSQDNNANDTSNATVENNNNNNNNTNTNTNDDDDQQKKIAGKFRGTCPNLHWKAFDEKDLQSHERFIPLLLLSSDLPQSQQQSSQQSQPPQAKREIIDADEEVEEVEEEEEEVADGGGGDDNHNNNNNNNNATDTQSRNLKQRDVGWHSARQGKLTASQFSKALGFFEKKAGKYLGLSPSMLRHNEILDVYCNLSIPLLLLSTQTVVDVDDDDDVVVVAKMIDNSKISTSDEIVSLPPLTATPVHPDVQLRMDWGTYHEVNAILTYLQLFPDFKVKETGFWLLTPERLPYVDGDGLMMPENLKVEWTDLPPIGASPDGIIIDKISDTPVAVLEAKCPCPFYPISSPSKSTAKKKLAQSAQSSKDKSKSKTKTETESGAIHHPQVLKSDDIIHESSLFCGIPSASAVSISSSTTTTTSTSTTTTISISEVEASPSPEKAYFYRSRTPH